MHYARVLPFLSIYFLLNSGLCDGALPREEIFSPRRFGFPSVWAEFKAYRYTGILPYIVHDEHTYYVMIKAVKGNVVGRIVIQDAQGRTTCRYLFTYDAGKVTLKRCVKQVNNSVDLPAQVLAFIKTEINQRSAQ